MQRREINRLNMYYAVDAVLKKHRDVVASYVPLAAAVKRLKESIITLSGYDDDVLRRTSGVMQAIKAAERNLIGMTIPVANALYVFGRNSANQELIERCRCTVTTLVRMRRMKMKAVIGGILELAERHAGTLEPFGITAGMLREFRRLIDTYNRELTEQTKLRVKSRAARQSMFELFAATSELLAEEIDPLIAIVRLQYPELYSEYRVARRIKNLGGSRKKRESGEK